MCEIHGVHQYGCHKGCLASHFALVKRMGKMSSRLLCVIYLSLAGLFLAACQSRSGDSTLLADNDCQSPCWKSITPGQTTRDSVLAQLGSLSEVNSNTIADNYVDEHRSNVWAEFSAAVPENSVRIFFIDQIALATNFEVRNAITVAQVIDKTGEPEFIDAKSGCADGRWLSIGLVNLSRGIYIQYFDFTLTPGEKAEISADSPVYRVIYFDPAKLDLVLHSYIFLDGSDNPDTFVQNLKLWDGYGEVSYTDICL